MKNLIVLSFAFVLLIGCSTANQQEAAKETNSKPADKAAQEKEVKDALVDMWDAIEKGDIDRYATYIHKDFTQFGETAKVLRVGKEAEVKAIKEWVEEPTKVATKMIDPRVTIRGDTAWIVYYWSDSGTTKGKPFATRGKSTRIFVREDGMWKCIHGHYTLLEDEKEETGNA